MITREKFNELKSQTIVKATVITGSMVPIINIGDKIVIEVGAKNLKRFDIIVIFSDGKLICHYLWHINEIVTPKLLQTRNMSGEKDFPIGEEDYLGKVISQRLSFWQKIKILFK